MILCECAIRCGGDYGITKKVKMAALEDVTTELSKLTNDISSAEFSHDSEVDFYIYKLHLLWKSIPTSL